VGTVVLMGRAPRCEVTLDDPMISDEHATLHIERGKPLELHDKGSKNGTYVNDQPVLETGVQPGDRIRIGHTTLRLEKGSVQ
jgi:pSer/pThr/pTyr-binding forkhead associated (FHA) protein